MAKLKGTQMLSDAGSIVALELNLIGGHTEDTRVGVRDKYRSVVQVVKRYRGDITQLDGFGRLATEAVRNQFGNS